MIVSKGPQAKEIEFAPNMAGAEFLPQTSILPKPMVVLPIFWTSTTTRKGARRVSAAGA